MLVYYNNNNLTVYRPVDRCGNLLLCSELQRVDNSEQLIKVPSCGGRVKDGQLQLLVGANHKDLEGVKMAQVQHNIFYSGDKYVHKKRFDLTYNIFYINLNHDAVFVFAVMQCKICPAVMKRPLGCECKKGGQVSYAASGERHSILISLIGVQHAQLDRQLSLVISDDGEGQSALSLTVKCHHILHRGKGHIQPLHLCYCEYVIILS